MRMVHSRFLGLAGNQKIMVITCLISSNKGISIKRFLPPRDMPTITFASCCSYRVSHDLLHSGLVLLVLH